MGTCVICGSPADGDVCDTHEEDVFFEFRGDHPDQLTPNRYYRGTVDGFAEFGVFVDIGPVTGLLHRSEIPKRLESLSWESGDAVFVQVLSVHDNGNIDLGWSLRQDPREFRGRLVDDPDVGAPVLPEKTDEDAEPAEEAPSDGTDHGEPAPVESQSEQSTADGGQTTTSSGGSTPDAPAETESSEIEEPERVPVADLESALDRTVAVEGTVTDVRQTAGPTVFALEDETGTVDCAAFESAGVRAYPDVEAGDVARFVGTVEEHRNEVQLETESVSVLTGPEAKRVADRRESALAERAEPETTTLLAEDPSVAAIEADLAEAATAIRRAVIESRPVIIRHTATLAGYVGGTALERALLPLVRGEHAESGAEYHYVDRRPLEDPIYDVEAATSDVTDMLEAADRHDETHPLFVLVDAGSTAESADGLSLLSIYDAESIVVDGGYADTDAAAADVLVSPTAAGGSPLSTGALGAQLAAVVNDGVRDDLAHLPATSFWGDPPEPYAELASEAGYDRDTIEDIRNAVALEAYYQSYEDKRELIADLFWAEGNESLAAPLSDQFETKLETEIETARPHLERREEGGVPIDVLDVAAYTHRYDFPPTDLLLAELHRRESQAADGPMVTIALDEDELFLERSTALDVRAIGEAVAERVEGGGVTPRGGRDGRIEFLSGRREAVLEAVIEEVSAWLG
ncbi:MAG: DHH family phosphoesterase [Halodesulfurarchaeum sp.]